MAQTSSFYNYIYDWQGIQHDSLLSVLLKSCYKVMNCHNIDELGSFISNVMLQFQLDGYYRLEVCQDIHIEHFQNGRHAFYHGERPQKGSGYHAIKVVELEHAVIFKMHFIQLYITKNLNNSEVLEDCKEIWLLWLMHIESVCLQASLQQLLNTELTPAQQEYADSMNFHLDLEINQNRLVNFASEMYQNFNEHIIGLLNPSEFIEPNKRQRLLIGAVSQHQEKLSRLTNQQYGLFLSSQRIMQALHAC